MLFKYHYICMDRRIRATQQNVNKGSLSLIERTEFFSIIFVCSKKETSFEIVERKKKNNLRVRLPWVQVLILFYASNMSLGRLLPF